ncbi:MAG: glycosyltransferase family 2 protein [Bradyrhizobium sp.]|nr:glycosyltransferase family 2 protein [Bradyrhizobium sp.]
MIAIILVNWNGKADTIECLESLMRLDSDDFLAIVVDNGSTDGSIAALNTWAATRERPMLSAGPWGELPRWRRRQPAVFEVVPDGVLAGLAPGSVAFVAAGANLGFAGANNVGMALARGDPRVQHILLLNNDTIVKDDVLQRLLTTAAEKPEAAIIGCCLKYYHAPHMVQGLAGFFNPWRAVGGHIGFGLTCDHLPDVADVEARMSYVMGAAMFLPVATLDEIGLMSEADFLYFEELNWARRLGRGRQSVCLNATVFHKEGGSIGSSSLTRPSDTSLYYLNRNLLRFMWRWHPLLVPVAILRVLREIIRYWPDQSALAILSTALVDGLFRKNSRYDRGGK